jgi:hypothetical protein
MPATPGRTINAQASSGRPLAPHAPPVGPEVRRDTDAVPAADWFPALHPRGPIGHRVIAPGVQVPLVTLGFRPWPGPPLDMAEDCNKRGGRVTGDAGELSCPEVEIVKRLRRAGWDACWVSAFRCGERRWGVYRMGPADLPPRIRDLEARVGVGDSGRPDVVAWTDQRVLYLESKGPNDSLKPGQLAWMKRLLDRGSSSTAIVVVAWALAAAEELGP